MGNSNTNISVNIVEKEIITVQTKGTEEAIIVKTNSPTEEIIVKVNEPVEALSVPIKSIRDAITVKITSIEYANSVRTFLKLKDTPSSYTGQALKGLRVTNGEDGVEFFEMVSTDEKVGVDSDATAGYLGVSSSDGVLRVDGTLGYVDGGNFITLSLDSTLKSNYDAASAHVSASGASHTYIDQSVISGASPTFINTNFTDSINKRYVTDAQLTVIENTSGVNTGDQTAISDFTGTMVEFDTACTDGNFAYSGGAFHDGFSDFVANEHIDHTTVSILAGGILSGGGTIASNRTISLAQADIDHDQLTNFEADEHFTIGSKSIGELSDVDDTGKDTGKIFKYNAVSGNWEVEDDAGGSNNWDKSSTITRIDGKITQIEYTDGDTIVYTRDSYGKVSSFTDGTKTWTLTRDANGGKITSGVVT